jgi:hypothetical protein
MPQHQRERKFVIIRLTFRVLLNMMSSVAAAGADFTIFPSLSMRERVRVIIMLKRDSDSCARAYYRIVSIAHIHKGKVHKRISFGLK